jgi:hypothetical protein
MRTARQREPQREPSSEAQIALSLDRIATLLEAINQNVSALARIADGMEQRFHAEQRAKSRMVRRG